MESLSKEARLILTLKALKKDKKFSEQAVVFYYKVVCITLHQRRVGRKSRPDMSVNSRKLTDLEERVLLKRVFDLNTRGF